MLKMMMILIKVSLIKLKFRFIFAKGELNEEYLNWLSVVESCCLSFVRFINIVVSASTIVRTTEKAIIITVTSITIISTIISIIVSSITAAIVIVVAVIIINYIILANGIVFIIFIPFALLMFINFKLLTDYFFF